MITEPIESGPYAGKTAKVFSSLAELQAASEAGTISDGEVFGFEQSNPVSAGLVDGQDYAYIYGSTSSGEIRLMSLHELPPPGWSVNSIEKTVVDPDGTIHLIPIPIILPIVPAWAIFVIKIIAVAALIAVIGTVIVCVLGAYKRLSISTSQQISDSEALISFPDAAGAIIDKDTGQVIHYENPPIDWKLLVIIVVIGVAAIVLVPPILRIVGARGESK